MQKNPMEGLKGLAGVLLVLIQLNFLLQVV